MKSVSEIVQNLLLPATTGETISKKEKKLYLLSIRSGGLGIPLVSEKIFHKIKASLTMAAPLVTLIINQGTSSPNASEIKETNRIITERKTGQLTNKVSKVEVNLDPDTKRTLTQTINRTTYRRIWIHFN